MSELDLDRLAKLAALHLPDEDRESLAGDLQRILEYVEILQSVDVDDVEPTHHPVATSTRLRADEPKPCLGAKAALEQAPRQHDGHFEVPPVLGVAAS